MALSEPVPNLAARSAPASGSWSPGRLLATSAFRVTALVVAGFVLAAALVVGALFIETNGLLTSQTLRALDQDRAQLTGIAAAGGRSALQQAITARVGEDAAGGALLLLIDGGGRKLAGNLPGWPAGLADKPQGGTFALPGGGTAAGVPVEVEGGARLLVGRDLGEQQALIDRMRRLFLWGFGLLSLVGLGGGLLASRLMLARVATIAGTGGEIVNGDLSRRIPLTGSGDEFDQLAVHLNGMLERIEQLMIGMREISDNIAHDLRTPLSRLRSRAETALREPAGSAAHGEGLARVIEDADAIIQTFNALLLIARLEAGAVEQSAEPFQLDDLVRDVAELYEPVAEEAGQRLLPAELPNCRVRANRQLIGQALANLIDNAIKYGVPDGGRQGEIAIALTHEDGRVRLAVADRGPGIPAADRNRVARRFVRLDRSRSRPGTGLGLSLVGAVARLHGGHMLIEDNAPGLRIVLDLPIAAG